jgi:hypothetical protein
LAEKEVEARKSGTEKVLRVNPVFSIEQNNNLIETSDITKIC